MSVLCFVCNKWEAKGLYQWSLAVSCAQNKTLNVVCLGKDAADVKKYLQEARPEVETLLKNKLRQKDAEISFTEVTIDLVESDLNLETALAQAKLHNPSLVIVGKHPKSHCAPGQEALARGLYEQLASATLILRLDKAERWFERLLVPTAGGPNAKHFLRLGEALSEKFQITLVPLYVEPPIGEFAKEVRSAAAAEALGAGWNWSFTIHSTNSGGL